MMVVSIIYVLWHEENRKYAIDLLFIFTDYTKVKKLLSLSWPVIVDKAMLSGAYVWLGAMINPMGKCAIASFTVIKDMERFAIQPAAAFAQVITFMVSNAYGVKDWDGIKSNIKKTVFLSSLSVFSILLIFSIYPEYFIHFFDKKGAFTKFAGQAFPLLSVLVFFDLLQLVLAGAMRGAANVKIVMMTRLVVCVGYFVPASYLLAQLSLDNMLLKFCLVYGSFYVGNALMSIIYIMRFRGEQWKKVDI